MHSVGGTPSRTEADYVVAQATSAGIAPRATDAQMPKQVARTLAEHSGPQPQAHAPLMVSGMVQDNEPEPDANLCCPTFSSCLLSCICPFSWLGAIRILDTNTEGVLLVWGKYKGVIREPGCFCINPCGTTLSMLSTKRSMIEFPNLKVLDSKGKPLIVSGVVSFNIENVKRARLDVEDPINILRANAQAVLKRVCATLPYEHETQPCLKSSAELVSRQLIQTLQTKVAMAGIRVESFDITDLSYAPEIAQAMLVRQQAEATVEARRMIVEGAVEITHSALAQLAERDVHMSGSESARTVSNLLTVICGDSGGGKNMQ